MISTTEAYDLYLDREIIYPKWKVLSFNPATDTWAQIIAGTYVQTPTDLTSYVQRIEHSLDRISVQMADTADLMFHPDAGALRTSIAQGRIIRVLEGFEGLAESEWVTTFSGVVEGSYAWVYQRGEAISVAFAAYGRGNNQAWKRRSVSSHAYTIGSDWGSMFMDIVKDVMLLADVEVVVPEPWGVLFDKNSNQIVNMPPWDAMEQLMFGIQSVPFFNGKGELDSYSKTQNRVTLALANDKYLRKYESKGSTNETINKIILTYLSNTLSRVEGPDQLLGSATITAGFFSLSPGVDVYYSDERKVRSDNPRLIIVQTVNTGFFRIGDEDLTKIDEFHSRIDIEIPVYIIAILIVLLAAYLLAATVGFFGVSELAQAVILMMILLLMMSIGSGQYEVWGTPYELVYLEQQAIAIKAGIEFWEEREKEIRNDFISTLEQAQPLVVNELHYEVMKENPRSLILRYDPRIEPGDIIQLSSTVKVFVESIARTITRGAIDASTMTIQGYRTVI